MTYANPQYPLLHSMKVLNKLMFHSLECLPIQLTYNFSLFNKVGSPRKQINGRLFCMYFFIAKYSFHNMFIDKLIENFSNHDDRKHPTNMLFTISGVQIKFAVGCFQQTLLIILPSIINNVVENFKK